MPSLHRINLIKSWFIYRISDQGGGISDDDLKEVFNYSFSTFKKVNQTTTSMLSDYSQTVNSTETIGSMAGFGFGLPTSRAYAEFLGGSLQLQSLYGYGTDVYVKLKRIEGDQEGFRLWDCQHIHFVKYQYIHKLFFLNVLRDCWFKIYRIIECLWLYIYTTFIEQSWVIWLSVFCKNCTHKSKGN